MRHTLRTVSLAVALGAGFAGTASAQEAEFSGNVTLTTDYVWRGISQSNEDFAVQGGFDVAIGSFYVGTWASSIDFEDGSDANVELDFYGGYAGELESGLGYDVGVVAYLYPDADAEDYDFVEIYGGLAYTFASGPDVAGYIYVDPDNQNYYAEASAGYAFTDAFYVGGAVGQYTFDEGEDYLNYSLGGTYSAAGFDFDLRFWATDIDDVDVAEERVVFSISRAM